MSASPRLYRNTASPRNDATCHFRTKCTAANGGLFDELVDAAKKRKWNVKTECFGSLEIDD